MSKPNAFITDTTNQDKDKAKDLYSEFKEKFKISLQTLNSLEEMRQLRKRYRTIKNTYSVLVLFKNRLDSM